MALPTALDSRVKITIDGALSVEATDFDIQKPTPAGFKFGAAGPIGPFFGQAASQINLTFATVAGRAQFQVFMTEGQPAKVVVFSKGAERYSVSPAYWTSAGIRGSYESGDMSTTASMIGILQQIA